MLYPGMTDFLIEHELGCGAFQVIEVIILYIVTAVPTYSTVLMMSFGRYNPGWRCLDISASQENYTIYDQHRLNGIHNASWGWKTRNESEWSRINATKTEKYRIDQSCQLFSSCGQIKFNPTSSTIVTEWSLLCDQSWVPSTIISIQMAGMLVGSLFAGQLADNIGRKRVFYGSVFLIAVLNVASAFSVTWRVFAVYVFFLGMSCAGMLAITLVYPAESVPKKWRAPITGFPAASLAGIFNGLITMALKDWRIFQVAVGGIAAFCFLSVVWVPESLRWLEVKNKEREYKTVAAKMARINNKTIPNINSADLIRKVEETTMKTDQKSLHNITKRYTYKDLFHKGYKLYTVILATQWFCLKIVYVSIAFGISIAGGDFYLNLVIMNCLAIPFGIFSVSAPNILGRKRSLLVCYILIALALGISVTLDITATKTTRDTGIIIMVMLIIACIESARGLIVLMATEIYPTVVRGLGVSWAKTVSRLGGIIAPLFIPTRPESVAAWYLALVVLALICCVLTTFLPETKGKPLKEYFEDETSRSSYTPSYPSSTETTRLLKSCDSDKNIGPNSDIPQKNNIDI